jgi:hypothetical protein
VPALDRLRGLRVVADAAALDGARWTGADGADPDTITVLRFAPDDAFALGAERVVLDDPHAIVEQECGFVGAWSAVDDIRPHIDWTIPSARPVLAQGSVAGVPAKIWLPGVDRADHDRTDHQGDRALVVTAEAYAAVLSERLDGRW